MCRVLRVAGGAVKQPKLGVPYVELVMLADVSCCSISSKRTSFGCSWSSGGGRDFMRAFAEETWGIYKPH